VSDDDKPSIAGDADTARQPCLDSCLHQFRDEERERVALFLPARSNYARIYQLNEWLAVWPLTDRFTLLR